MPVLSVIIPIFNVEHYIERCARSLFEQTLQDIEYIFVDDCSPDNSVDKLLSVIECYPLRKEYVTVIRHTENRGLTNARNTGLSFASGEYVTHCDSDDWLDKDAYRKLYDRALLSNADICLCDIRMVYPNNTVNATLPGDTNKRRFIKTWIASGMTPVWAMIAKRSLYTSHNLSSPSNLTYCEDFHLTMRLLIFAEKVVKVDEPLYCYNRLNLSSLLNDMSPKAQMEEITVYQEIIKFLKDENVWCIFEEEMSWRLLKCLQQFCFEKHNYEKFRSLYMGKRKYILSCPSYFCNIKVKLMMLMLSFKMDCCVDLINVLRKRC